MDNQLTKNKYSSLVSNTLLFAISAFGSKILSLALTPLITTYMPDDQFGIAFNIVAICNVILPLMYLCINEAVIRYGMENDIPKSDIYTTSISVVLIGFFVVILAFPLIRRIPNTKDYLPYLYAFILASAMRTITTHFVRSLGEVRLFAFDGILTTVLNFTFIILFIIVWDMGVVGYILATILPDAISTIFLTLRTRAWQYFSPSKLNKTISFRMIGYSLPLVPAAVSWWITNSSNRLILTNFIDESATGRFEGANKIPQLLIIVSTIFIQAWQISAFSEDDPEESRKFFSKIFNSYSALVFLAGSGIILLLRPLTSFLVKYEGVWVYSPFLILSVIFSCLVTFLGTIYNFNKRNFMVTFTTIIGAIINILLNLWLIPKLGMQGAAIATFLCYLIVFVIRIVDTRRFMKLDVKPVRIVVNLLLLLAQIYVCIKQVKFGIPIQIVIALLVTLNNASPLLFILRQGMGALYRVRKRKARK